MNEIQTFFDNAMKNRFNSAAIQRIAKDVAPSYCCRSIKHRRLPSAQERLEILYSEIEKGRARVVLINDSLKAAHKQNVPVEKNDKNLSEKLDFFEFLKNQLNHLKKIYSNIIHADYHFLDKIIHVDEYTTAVPVIIDPSSIKEHSTGWKDWDDPFEIGMFGALKASVIFNLAVATKLNNSAFMAAAAGYVSEGVKCQYKMTGKSIACKQWYGSYCIRFNIKAWYYEIAWIKYDKSGPNERILVELNRADRVMKEKNELFKLGPKLIQPLITMEEFLSNYKNIFVPPEHDVNTPISLNKGLLGI